MCFGLDDFVFVDWSWATSVYWISRVGSRVRAIIYTLGGGVVGDSVPNEMSLST